jgi:hypothetical protein
MNTRTVAINANGQVSQEIVGDFKYLRIQSATVAFQLSFDGGTWVNAQQNNQWGPITGTRVYFRALNGLASAVTFVYSDQPFTSQDTAVLNAATSVLGNLGVPAGTGAAGGLPACDANGWLQITNGLNLKVSGTNNGHRRQLIVFAVQSGTYTLSVTDANGCAVVNVVAGNIIAIATDSDLYVSGAGGLSKVTIGQFFYAQ